MRSCSTTTGRTLLADAARIVGEATSPQREAGAAVRRPDQHPVHLRHDRLPQGRDALAPQHPQQRATSSARRWATPSTTASASRCRSTTASAWCWATSPAPATARAWWSRARRSTRSRCSRRSQAERCTSLYGVPTMFIAELDHPRFAEFDLSSLRTGIMAGAPCPIELMKTGRRADAHARSRHRLRHDGDLAGLDA